MRYVLLLRGINVGGNNKIAMADLRGMLEGMGFSNVRTLLQSGNAAFTTKPSDTTAVQSAIEAAIQETFDLRIACLVLTAHDIEQTISENPLTAETAEPKKLHATFLFDTPTTAGVDSFDQSTIPETFAVRNQVLYVFYANGAGTTKLTEGFWKKLGLGTTGTARNWNTVLKLRDLVSE